MALPFGLSRLFARSYDAATLRPARFDAGRARFGSYGPEISAARGTIQARARHAVENNPLANAIIAAWETTAIGAGIVATSQHPDPEIRTALDAHFKRWTRRADYEGLTDWFGLQAAMVRAERTDGDGFAMWQGDQLRRLPAELIDMNATGELPGGAFDMNGIRVGADGRVEGYHVLRARPADLIGSYAPPVFVPASEMIHLYRPPGPGALRGTSALAPVLLRLAELDGAEDAYQKNVRVAALLSVILTNENDMSGTDPFADGQTLEPGAMFKVPGGWRVNTTAPAQVQQIGEFLSHMTRTISTGAGVPDYLVTGDLRQANYSSLRSAMVAFRQRVEQYQFHTLVPMVLDPVWRRIITMGIISGQIEAPGFEDDPESFFAVEWIPPKQLWIDPQKDAAATGEMLALGIMSRRQAVAEQGYSVEQLDAEIAADRQRERDLGLSFGTPTPTTGGPTNG